MFSKSDDNFTLTIIYTLLLDYLVHLVAAIPHKTQCHTFLLVYKDKLLADNLASTCYCNRQV